MKLALDPKVTHYALTWTGDYPTFEDIGGFAWTVEQTHIVSADDLVRIVPKWLLPWERTAPLPQGEEEDTEDPFPTEPEAIDGRRITWEFRPATADEIKAMPVEPASDTNDNEEE